MFIESTQFDIKLNILKVCIMENKITERKNLNVKAFFDETTNTASYLIWDSISQEAAIIDPVFDYDSVSGKVNTHSADLILTFSAENNLKIKYILETHAHADHLSGAPYIKTKTGAKIAIGKDINLVQEIFRPMFNIQADETDFDILLSPKKDLYLGKILIKTMPTPGHTPACVSYKIEDSIFVGDTLFMPDYGTARCDFPGGSADDLYDSVQFILSHPKHTKLYMCHDYKAKGRENYAWETDVATQLSDNIHINETVSKSDFVKTRNARDKTLRAPKLLLPSIQVNINAGNLPKAENNGVSYLKIPIKSV